MDLPFISYVAIYKAYVMVNRVVSVRVHILGVEDRSDVERERGNGTESKVGEIETGILVRKYNYE